MNAPEEQGSPYEKEFNDYWDEHQPQILRSACYRFREVKDAEDVTQETFLKLWKVWPERREAILETPGYAYAVLGNNITDHYRKHSLRLDPSDRTETTGEAHDIDPIEFLRKTLTPLKPRISEVGFRTLAEGQSA